MSHIGTRKRRRGARFALAVLAGFALVAAACGGSDTDTAGGDAGTVLDASALTGTATTVSGASFDLGTLADKDLVVWFWAPW
jgi:hypothetical protein